MHNFSTLIFILFFGCCFAQHPGNGACSLQPDNKTWLSEFKKTDKGAEQIDLVINKIISDSDYFFENPEIANLDDRRVFGNVPCSEECSIRFGLIYGKNKGFTLDLKKNPELEDLMAEFNSENIYRIELNERHKKDVYKNVGVQRSGVVLYTSDKELKKKIKKAVKKIEKAQPK